MAEMTRYLDGEFYKVFRRKYLYIFLAFMLAGELLLSLIWAWGNAQPESGIVNNQITFGSGVGIVSTMLPMGLYVTLLLADMVFSEQYKFGTMKNEVSAGLPRTRVYLGKLITAEVVGMGICVFILAFYGAACRLLLPVGPGDAADVLSTGFLLLCALPLWMGALSLAVLLYFLMKSNTVASFVFVGFLAVGGPGLNLLGMMTNTTVSSVARTLYRLTLTAPFDVKLAAAPDWPFFGYCLALGLGWMAVSTAAGLAAFRKKEIN